MRRMILGTIAAVALRLDYRGSTGGFMATDPAGAVIDDARLNPYAWEQGEPHSVSCDGDAATLTSPTGVVTTLQRGTGAPEPSAPDTTAAPAPIAAPETRAVVPDSSVSAPTSPVQSVPTPPDLAFP